MMKHTTLGLALSLCLPLATHAQIAFTNSSALLSNTTNSGGCMGVVDMNGDGLDDICKLDNSRVFMVDYQNPDGTFTLVNYGSMSGSGQWGFSIGDINNSGHKDVISGGSYDGVHYLRITDVGESTLTDLNNDNMFMQCNNIVDINNDGFNDFYACHDDAAPRQWLNAGDATGTLTYADIINYDTDPSSDRSGNYGSVWMDFDNDGDLDLYIAKCRQGVNNPDDPRRWNRLFVNDGNGNFTDQAVAFGVQVRYQSWTADFGDIDNDGDLDMVLTNHDATIQLFENDGMGNFTEITAGSGLEVTGFFLQSKFVDLDNDGFLDLLIAGGSGAHFTFRNNGNNTFNSQPNTFPAPKAMHSFATGDLNNDGFVDVWANYGSGYINADNNNPDRLWLNEGNDNHWLTVRLQGTVSNRDAIGARVTITGPWGTQIREVRAGESYGMVTTFASMFGLGNETVVPTVTVRWPSGLVETFTDIAADQTITIIEGTCISPVAAVTSDDAFVVCGNGDSLSLSANAGFDYAWNTGATTQSIDVVAPGYYQVTIDDNGCTAVAGVFVELSPDETPMVTVEGNTTFCEGGQVVLTSSAAAGYTWSNGAQAQSVTIDQGGTYSVTIDGACGAYQSAPVEVTMLDAADAPVVDDVSIPAPGSATLVALAGDNINWYDVPTGGTSIGSGNVFQTPVVNVTTSFWASATTIYGAGSVYGGKVDNSAQGVYHTNSDNYQFFEATEAFTLISVKVYANSAGNRTVRVIDRSNGSTVAEQVINIPAGESRIQLDFDIPGAGQYGLRTVGGNPQLWRDGLGSNPAYPYALGSVGAITSSSVAGGSATAYWYFFYDWEVGSQITECEGPREEAIVNVGSVGLEGGQDADVVRVWPNPAVDLVIVSLGAVEGRVLVDMMDVTGRIVLTRNGDAFAQGGQLEMNVRDLAHGEYLVRVQHDGGISTHRVVVH